MSQLSTQDIAHLAHLARLELTEEERERFALQLSSVVGYVDQLSAATVPHEAPVGVTGLYNVLSEDVVRNSENQIAIPRDLLLAGAPRHKEGFIQVRAVMAGEEGGA